MYKRSIPLIPQDELAYELGLTVPEKDIHLFSKVRTGNKPKSGWGTQIQDKRYEPNKIFSKLGIPLKFKRLGIKEIKDRSNLVSLLTNIQNSDRDAMLCFDYGRLWDIEPSNGGHVCVFDYIDGDEIFMIDPERNVPKHRGTTPDKLLSAINFHGDDNATGIWLVESTK
jgi:hypothetical protein